MKRHTVKWSVLFISLAASIPAVLSQDHGGAGVSSYMPVDIHETFASIMARMSAAKPEIMRRHLHLRQHIRSKAGYFVVAVRGTNYQEVWSRYYSKAFRVRPSNHGPHGVGRPTSMSA